MRKGLIIEDAAAGREEYSRERQKAAALGQKPDDVKCPACGKSGKKTSPGPDDTVCLVCGRVQ